MILTRKEKNVNTEIEKVPGKTDRPLNPTPTECLQSDYFCFVVLLRHINRGPKREVALGAPTMLGGLLMQRRRRRQITTFYVNYATILASNSSFIQCNVQISWKLCYSATLKLSMFKLLLNSRLIQCYVQSSFILSY